MEKRDNFEKKIKSKLEEVQTPYDESAWTNFTPLLDASKVPFWKAWYTPYLYSSALFVMALLMFRLQYKSPRMANLGSKQMNGQVVVDTIVRRDTVYIVDTVFVVKKVYVNETSQYFSNNKNQNYEDQLNSYSQIASAKKQSINPSISTSYNNSEQNDSRILNNPKEHSNNLKLYPNNKNIDSANEEIAAINASGDKTLDSEEMSSLTKSDSLSTLNIVEKTPKVANEDEPANGTAKVVEPAIVKIRNKPTVNVESSIMLMIPISQTIEYYSNIAQRFNVGLLWKSGWGLYIGAIRNHTEGEIDDDDLSRLNLSALSSATTLPWTSQPLDLDMVDEIYVTNRQWFFPVELRWKSADYNGFNFESSFAVLGNYLSKEHLEYEFDHRQNIDSQFETLLTRQFNLSHLKVGVGTGYLFEPRWGVFLRSHYWKPIAPTGVFDNKMHGLELSMGLHHFIGQKK